MMFCCTLKYPSVQFPIARVTRVTKSKSGEDDISNHSKNTQRANTSADFCPALFIENSDTDLS